MTVFANRNGGPPPRPQSRWKRARRAATELTNEAIEQIAERVAALLRAAETTAPSAAELLDATELAGRLGVSRDWVYEHADELGVITLGDGPKPRLRFRLETAEQVLRSRTRTPASPPAPAHGGSRRRRPAPPDGPLLPIRQPKSRGLVAVARRLRGRSR